MESTEVVPEVTRPSREASSVATILGQGARVVGDVTLPGSVRIDGIVEGRVEAGERVEISPGGTIRGEVSAAEVQVGGAVEGSINATRRVELRNGARVEGDIRTERLSMAEGALFDGSCAMSAEARKVRDHNQVADDVKALRVVKPE